MGENRQQVDPDKIPWDALRTLISQSVFGGKIDNEYDQKILLSLVNQFFCAESFDLGYKLFQPPLGEPDNYLSIPEAKSHAEFDKWIKAIDLTESPAWSGLPNNVEKIVREARAEELWNNSKLIQGTNDEED